MKINKNYFFVFVSASLMGLSQHQLSLGFLAWFGLIPFLYVLLKQQSYKSVFLISFLWGLIYNIIILYWLSMNIGTIKVIAIITMFFAVLIMSFNSVFTCLLWYRIKKYFPKYKLILFPVIWVSIEYIRSYGILGFPWISIANSQIDYLYLIQNAQIVGIYGISFWVVMINVLLYSILLNNVNRMHIIYTLSAFIFPWILGYYLYLNVFIPKIDESALKLSLIQPNINLESKRDIDFKDSNLHNLIEVSNIEIEKGSKLIIWPESAAPFHRLQFESQRQTIVDNMLVNNNSYLLSGNIIRNSSGIYNSTILFNEYGIEDIYNKRQPVPLAEYVPFSSTFPHLKALNIGSSNFSKGKTDVIFNIDNISFTGMICFESIFPEINRRHVNKGADALVYLVNDGWYQTEPEPTQHARQSIYRAIENRRPVVRCANTGISMIVNERGEVQDEIGLNKSGTLSTSIMKNNYKTFYTRFGNVFALILLAISGMFLFMTLKKNEKK